MSIASRRVIEPCPDSPEQAGGRPRTLTWILRGAALIALALLLLPLGTAMLWEPAGALLARAAQWSGYRQDFTAPYAAARMIASGSRRQIYDLTTLSGIEAGIAGHPVGGTGTLGYFNPPFFALLLMPLTRLSLERAYQVWTAGSLALLGVDLWLLWRVAAGLSRRTRLVLVVAFATLMPITYGLLLGQFSLILVTCWMAAFLLLRAGHERWAGVALAPLLIKPELVVPVVLFLALKRRWRALTTLLPLTMLAVGVSVLVVGLSSALSYPSFLLHSTQWQTNGVASNIMFDWNGIVAMFASRPAAAPIAALAVGALSLATLGVVWHSWSGDINTRSPRFALQWCVLTAATVLIDPHLYLQDTILLAPPAIGLLAATPERHRGAVGAALMAGWALLMMGSFPNEQLGINLFGMYVVAGGAALVFLARKWSPSTTGHGAPTSALEGDA